MRSSFFKKTENLKLKGSLRVNRRLVTFVICLFVSVLLWLLLYLSKEYTVVLNFPAEYVNLPKDRILANELPASIDMEIRAKGFNLLPYKIFPERELIHIDLKDARPLAERNHHFLLTNYRTDKVTSQFSNSIHITRIRPDTIFLNFNKKTSKTVPVIANLEIECEGQYELSDSIRLNPSSIEISGASDVLASVTELRTVPMKMKKVKSSMLLKMNILRTPELKQIEFSNPTVQAIVNVAKYTEGSMELPVEVENLPAGYSLKTFPDKVTVKYKVRFEDYEKISASLFRVMVDYSKIEPGNNKLKLHIITQPAGIRAVKLSTEKVEYIIRK